MSLYSDILSKISINIIQKWWMYVLVNIILCIQSILFSSKNCKTSLITLRNKISVQMGCLIFVISYTTISTKEVQIFQIIF